MIAKLSKSMGAALVGNNFSPIPPNFSFHMKKKSVVTARNLQSIKTFLALELSPYRKSGSTVSSSEPVAARSDCCRLGNALWLCLPVRPAQAVPERGPKSHWFGSQIFQLSAIDLEVRSFDWPLIWKSDLSIVFSNSLREWLPDDRHWSAGAQTWTQTWTLQPDQWVVEVLSALKPQNKVQ